MQFDWTVHVTDIVMIVAILAGPIAAVWASDRRAQRRLRDDRKEWVFRTLMTTRSARLRNEHVAALNHIVFAFPRHTHSGVQDAWGLYQQHLRNQEGSSQDQAVRQAWHNKASDLLAELLYRMAIDLKISFSKTEITDTSYHPDAYVIEEFITQEIRRLTLEVLKDGRPVNIRAVPNKPES